MTGAWRRALTASQKLNDRMGKAEVAPEGPKRSVIGDAQGRWTRGVRSSGKISWTSIG